MVTLKYTGTGMYIVGGYQRIPSYRFMPNQVLEMEDEHFWFFMKSKTFAFRVNNNIIHVPREFPLEKPKAIAAPSEEKSESNETPDNLPSLKATLRSIEESSDADFLNKLSETDPRDKVKDAVAKRLKSLESAK